MYSAGLVFVPIYLTYIALPVLALPPPPHHSNNTKHGSTDLKITLPGQPLTETINGLDIVLPGQPLKKVINGLEITLPGRPLPHPVQYHVDRRSTKTKNVDGLDIVLPDYIRISPRHQSWDHGAIQRGLHERAVPPGKLFGPSNLPDWRDARQNESIATCGLTSALQSISRLLPEILAANLYIQDSDQINTQKTDMAISNPDSIGTGHVLVGVTDPDVQPLVKLGVMAQRSSVNSSNMNAGEVWWPSAFEKAIEALGQRTTYILASRAMTMITSFPAIFNLTTNSGFSADEVPGGLADADGTWGFFTKWSGKTPITVQTLEKMDGRLQKNHVFTVLGAEEVNGIKTLHLHNPLGWDENLPFAEAWPQFYLFNYVQGLPTRESFGLSPSPPHQESPSGVMTAVKPSYPSSTSARSATSSTPKEQGTTIKTALVSSPVSNGRVSRSLTTMRMTKVPQATGQAGPTGIAVYHAKLQGSDKEEDDADKNDDGSKGSRIGLLSGDADRGRMEDNQSGVGRSGQRADSMLQRLGKWFDL